ncbi:MAG: hypothetical protein ACOCR6_01490, partial [archaeon]
MVIQSDQTPFENDETTGLVKNPEGVQSASSENARGQMLLIGGVVLAVILVALATILNGAIYTSVMAGDGESTSSQQEALEFQKAVDGMVGRMIDGDSESVHVPDYAPAWGLRDRILSEDNISALQQNLDHYYAQSNKITNVSINYSIKGRHVTQNETGTFESEGRGRGGGGDPESDWEIADGNNIREFLIEVESTTGNDFVIQITGDSGAGDTWEINPESNDQVTVRGPNSTTTCSESAPITIDITGEKVNGEHCSALNFWNRIEGPYRVEIRDGDQAEGTY